MKETEYMHPKYSLMTKKITQLGSCQAHVLNPKPVLVEKTNKKTWHDERWLTQSTYRDVNILLNSFVVILFQSAHHILL